MPGWESRVFGCSLTEHVGVAQLLWASALLQAGRFDTAFAATPEGQKICSSIALNAIETVVNDHFSMNVQEARAIEEKTMARLATKIQDRAPWRRFAYNPLLGKPVVSGSDDGLLIPVPLLAWRKATPEGVYHAGREALGTGFAEETGYLFEEYIGRQLRLVEAARLVPEITYKQGRDQLHSVDWIVVFDDLVSLPRTSARTLRPVRVAASGRVPLPASGTKTTSPERE